jgi:hypothetical protein
MKNLVDKSEKIVYIDDYRKTERKPVLIESGEYLKSLDDWIASTRINMHNDFE